MLYSIIKYLSIYIYLSLSPSPPSREIYTRTTPLVLEKNQYFENISEIIYGSNFTLLS